MGARRQFPWFRLGLILCAIAALAIQEIITYVRSSQAARLTWSFILSHLLSSLGPTLLLSVLIYLIVDLVASERQKSELSALLIAIINGEPEIAAGLALDQRKKFAEYWFEATASDTIAKKALKAYSNRYLSEDNKWRYRISRGLSAELCKLDADIVHPDNLSLTFSPSFYLRCKEYSKFSLPPYDDIYAGASVTVIAPLTHEQLTCAYKKHDCIFRNMMVLEPSDRDDLKKELEDRMGLAEYLELDVVERPAHFHSILGGLVRGALSVHLSSGKTQVSLKARYEPEYGIVLEYDIPKLKDSKDFAPIFDVTLEYLQSRRRQWFVESFNEATLGFSFELKCNDAIISDMEAHEFFSVSMAKRVDINKDDPCKIVVDLDGLWIFPVSGVVVTWRDLGIDLAATNGANFAMRQSESPDLNNPA
jgi:hypothetical protein